MRRKLFIGPRLRRLREERGLTQAELARRIEISPSYLNQIEHDQRPLSVAVLLRLTETVGLDVSDLSDDADAGLAADLHAALADPELGAVGPIRPQEAREVAASHPEVARALVALHARARDAQRRVEEMAVGLGARVPSGAGAAVLPQEQVLDFIRDSRNHFPALDHAAEDLGERVGPAGAGAAEGLTRLLAERHDVRVVLSDARGDRRRFDRDHRVLTLRRDAGESRRAFQLAVQVAHLEHGKEIARLTDTPTLASEDARALARIGLANYFAGAVLLPYRRFLGAAEESGYDIGLLADRFGVSIETVCHRLSTLQRPGEAGVPFVFVRVDRAGNVSKRHSATDFHFSRVGGNCPLWTVHQAFSSPGRFLRQVARMPGGRTYLWVARMVSRRAGAFGTPSPEFALGLGCDVRHAPRLVYSRGLVLDDPATVVPIGPGCRLCEREDCAQRALPLVGRPLDTDEDRTHAEPYRPL